MDHFKPFLQIVHVSDLHVGDPTSLPMGTVRDWIRKLKWRVSTGLADLISDGTAPHDPLAVSLFKNFLEEMVQDHEWKGCATWLVDTGDLTSLGDQPSLNLGIRHLNDFQTVCPKSVSIYGNHDGWPGKLPAFSALVDIQAQPSKMIGVGYSVATPRMALKEQIPHGAGEIQLYSADSIILDLWQNTLALGEVADSQLMALKNLVDANSSVDRRDFRILVVHHPVHYPPPRPRFQMSMKNDSHVAKILDTSGRNRAYPLVHLVLSGHTHYCYPPHGQLPSEPSLCNHPDLGDAQCQLVVGSLMQLDRQGKRLGWPHQCEVLRFYYSDQEPTVVSVDRLLAARQTDVNRRGTGIGPYKFVPLSKDSSKFAEEITFSV